MACPGHRQLTQTTVAQPALHQAYPGRGCAATGFPFPIEGGKLKIRVIHNGVDLNRFRRLLQARAGPIHPPRAAVVIGAVGRVEARRDSGSLAGPESIETGRATIPASDCRRGYGQRLFRAAWTTATQAGIAERVEFLGHVDPIEPFMRSVDIAALPSSGAEAFPRAVLEAMACGKPVVVTDAGGTPEAVVEGRTGFVVPTRAPEVLAARLRDLLTDEGLRIRMGRCGRRRAEALFDVTQNAAQTARVYSEVLGCC